MSTAESLPTEPSQMNAHEVDPSLVRHWTYAGEARIIDVREPDERAAEWIEGSVSHPLSSFDPLRLIERFGDQRVVFLCRGGRRSLEALDRYRAAGGRDAASLRGGIEAWKLAAGPVSTGKAPPISIMRQVQIVIGVLLLAGCALALWVDPWFLLLPACLGAGLTFAGLSGTCGLAAVLAAMPWNRFERPESGCRV